MKKIKLSIEVEVNEGSRVSENELSCYILRDIAGVVGANKAMVMSYTCSNEGKKD